MRESWHSNVNVVWKAYFDCGGRMIKLTLIILLVRFIQAMDSEADWGRNFFTSADMIKETYHSYMQDVYREAHLDGPAPDVAVVSAR